MLKDSIVLQDDIDYVIKSSCIPWGRFEGKRVLVTGSTGLVGSTIVFVLNKASKELDLKIEIYALARSIEKARSVFRTIIPDGSLNIIEGTVEEFPDVHKKFDFIIHTASPTASKYFVEQPVETIKTSVIGTCNILDKAKNDKSDGVVYLSSMEAYGEVRSELPLVEENLGLLDLSSVRNSYSESKRMCEMMCKSFAYEYNIPVMSIRLAQTFGPGIDYNDPKVFAMMARCAVEKKDIVLKTRGKSKHSYLYSAQAVAAILTVLTKGKAGETYNAANPNTYSSIYEMAKLVAKRYTNNTIRVLVGSSDSVAIYPNTSYLNLDISKIEGLGWHPIGDLEMMFDRLIDDWMYLGYINE